jgi:hypothetical protein
MRHKKIGVFRLWSWDFFGTFYPKIATEKIPYQLSEFYEKIMQRHFGVFFWYLQHSNHKPHFRKI